MSEARIADLRMWTIAKELCCFIIFWNHVLASLLKEPVHPSNRLPKLLNNRRSDNLGQTVTNDVKVVTKNIQIGLYDHTKIYLLSELEGGLGAWQSFQNPTQIHFQGLPDKSSDSKYIDKLLPSVISYQPLFKDDDLKFQNVSTWHNCSWMLDLEQDMLLSGCSELHDQDAKNPHSSFYIYKLDESTQGINLINKTNPVPFDIVECYDFLISPLASHFFALCEHKSSVQDDVLHKLSIFTLSSSYEVVNSTLVFEQRASAGDHSVFQESSMLLSIQTVEKNESLQITEISIIRLIVYQTNSWNITTFALTQSDTDPVPYMTSVGQFPADTETEQFLLSHSLCTMINTNMSIRMLIKEHATGEPLERYYFIELPLEEPDTELAALIWDLAPQQKVYVDSVARGSLLKASSRIKRLLAEDGNVDSSYTYVTLTQTSGIYVFLFVSEDSKKDSPPLRIGEWTYFLSPSQLASVLHQQDNLDNWLLVIGLNPQGRLVRIYLSVDQGFLTVHEDKGQPFTPVYALTVDNPSYPNKFTLLLKELNGGVLVKGLAAHEVDIGVKDLNAFPTFPVPFELVAKLVAVDTVTKDEVCLQLQVTIFQGVNLFSIFDMRNTFSVFLGQKSYIPILPVNVMANSPVFSVEIMKSDNHESFTAKASVRNHLSFSQISLPRSSVSKVDRFSEIGDIYFRLQTRGSSTIIACLTSTSGGGKTICVKLFEITFDPTSEALLSMRYSSGFIITCFKFFQGSLRRLQIRIHDLQGGLVAKSVLYEYDVSELHIREDLNGDIVIYIYSSKANSGSSLFQPKSIYYGIILITSDRRVKFPVDMTLYRALPISLSVKQIYWTPSISFNVLTLVLNGVNSKPSVMLIMSIGKTNEVTFDNSFILYNVDLLPPNTSKKEKVESCSIGENPVLFLMTSQQIITVQRLDEFASSYVKISLPFAEYGMTKIIDYACLRDEDFLQVLAEKKSDSSSEPTYHLISYTLNSAGAVNSRVHSIIQLPSMKNPPTHVTAAPQILAASAGLEDSEARSQEVEAVYDVVTIIATSGFEQWLAYSFNTGAPLLEIDVSGEGLGQSPEVSLKISMTPFGAPTIFKISREIRLEIREAQNPVVLVPQQTDSSRRFLRDHSDDLCPFISLETGESRWNIDDLLGIQGTILTAKLDHVSPQIASIEERLRFADNDSPLLSVAPKMMNVRSRHGCVLVWNENHLFIYENNAVVYENKFFTVIKYLGFPPESELPVIIICTEFTGERSLFFVIYRDPGTNLWVAISRISNIEFDYARSSVVNPVVIKEQDLDQPAVVSFYCIIFGFQTGSQYIFKSLFAVRGGAQNSKPSFELETKLLHGFDDPVTSFDQVTFSNIAHVIVMTKRSAQIHIINTDRLMENYKIATFDFEPLKMDAIDGLFTCNLVEKSADHLHGRIMCLLSTLSVESYKFSISAKVLPGTPFSKVTYLLAHYLELQNLQGFSPTRGSIFSQMAAIKSQNRKASQYSDDDFPTSSSDGPLSSGKSASRTAVSGEESVIMLFTDNTRSSSAYDSQQAIAVITPTWLQSLDPSQRIQSFNFDLEVMDTSDAQQRVEIVVLVQFERYSQVRRFVLSNLTLHVIAPGKIHKKKGVLVLQGMQNTIKVGLDQIFKPNWSRIIFAWSGLLLIGICLFITGACILKYKGAKWFPSSSESKRRAKSFGSEEISLGPELEEDKYHD